jgi:hypothetical protein
VGNSSIDDSAIAVIGVSSALNDDQLAQIESIPAIQRVWQISL